jgi:DNA-binding beta-propeller fold protein YncE
MRWMHAVILRSKLKLSSLLLLLLPSAAAGASADSKPLVWPPPPDAPRIAFVRALGSPADLGVKRSALGKLANLFVGNPSENEPFIKPFGIALDEQGGLCFTDTGANTVCFFDRARKLWRRWDQIGKLRFSLPVAVAKSGRSIFVADSGLASVIAFDDGGKLLFQITNGLQRPAGVAIASNRLFVVDSQAQGIFIYDLQGRPVGQFGRRGAGDGGFNFPTHISADAAGNLLVTDSMNSRIQVFDSQGKFLRQFGSIGDTPGHFSRPKGVAADSFGHLYILDANFDNVQVFDPAGRLLMDLGQAGQQPGEFWLPNGIAIGRDNEIYITDSYNRRIQVFKFISQP